MKKNSLLTASAGLLGLVACLVPSAFAQTYNWDGNGTSSASGNWSTGTNWNPDAPANDPGTGDTANLVDTGANRVVTYDAGASGALGTLNFNQASAFTNTLDLARGLNVTNAITLSATTGVEEIRISPGAASVTLVVPTLNIATGGLLTMKFGTANAQAPGVQGAISMTGGNVTVVSGLVGSAAQATVSSNFTMSGGTLTIGTGNDTRIQVSGNFTATGGAITSTGGTLSMLGATNSLSGSTTLNTSTQITLEGSVAQSLTSSANLNTVLMRNNAATDVAKTITLTGTATTVGQLQFRTPTAGRATNLVLGSNLSSSASAANPSMIASVAGTVGAGIDTAGFTLDLSTSSAGVWTPNNVSGANLVNWNLTNSAGSGKIKAAGFNFSAANQVNVGAGLTLEASGGNAATINVSGGGSIDAASTIRYSGAAATGTPALLTSNRTIGNLDVASGALKVSGSSITAAGLLTVGSGATLDLSAFGLTANGLAFDNGSLNTPANLTIVGAGSTVVKTGASTLTLSGSGNTYGGGTTLSAGTMILAHNSAAGTGGIAVSGSAAATLQVNSGITVANNITFSNSNAATLVNRQVANATAYTVGTSGLLASSFAGGQADTSVSILAGTNAQGSTATLAMRFSDTSVALNDAIRKSDVFSLNGTASDTFVLQLNVTGLAAGNFIGWLNGGSWVNAVNGNSGAGALAGAYTTSFATFLANNGGSFNATTMLGAYGVDTTGGATWAVLNHNSDFAAVPEPSTWLLLAGTGTFFMIMRRRRDS